MGWEKYESFKDTGIDLINTKRVCPEFSMYISRIVKNIQKLLKKSENNFPENCYAFVLHF